MVPLEVRKLILDILKECNIEIPIKAKYAGVDLGGEPEKMLKFLELTNEDYTQAVYVDKGGHSKKFDLLFILNDAFEPVCVPLPIIERIFECEIKPHDCGVWMNIERFEKQFKWYYDRIRKERDNESR